VYAAQLEATPVDASTIKALQAWETKKRFYLRMNRVDDVSGALVFISVCTAVAICQLTYDGFISMDRLSKIHLLWLGDRTEIPRRGLHLSQPFWEPSVRHRSSS
jgi:hypothetical protein